MEAVLASRNYIEIEPRVEWVQGEAYDTILIDLSGFKKEQLKVQVDGSRKLKISGECHIQGNQWRRFLKDFPIPEDCDIRTVQANLDGGILYLILPKKATQVDTMGQGMSPTSEQLEDIRKEDSRGKAIISSDKHPNQGMEAVVDRLRSKRQLIMNIAVAVLVAGLGIYVKYRLRTSEETDRN